MITVTIFFDPNAPLGPPVTVKEIDEWDILHGFLILRNLHHNVVKAFNVDYITSFKLTSETATSKGA